MGLIKGSEILPRNVLIRCTVGPMRTGNALYITEASLSVTRMHSSRIPTARLRVVSGGGERVDVLTWSRGW